MSSNPYQSPQVLSEGYQGVDEPATLQRLRLVAQYQRWVIAAVGINLVLYILIGAIGNAHVIVRLGLLLSLLTGVVFSIVSIGLLTHKLYGAAAAILCAILAMLPCISLITLLIVNQKATKVLQQAGLKVGFFGVDSKAI